MSRSDPYRAVAASIREDFVPKDAYLSRRWLELENERLWPRVWQIACRNEEVARVGDYVTYDIADECRTESDVEGDVFATLRGGHEPPAHRRRADPRCDEAIPQDGAVPSGGRYRVRRRLAEIVWRTAVESRNRMAPVPESRVSAARGCIDRHIARGLMVTIRTPVCSTFGHWCAMRPELSRRCRGKYRRLEGRHGARLWPHSVAGLPELRARAEGHEIAGLRRFTYQPAAGIGNSKHA